MMLQHLRRMARYNRWANERLYAACGELGEAGCMAQRQAFFGSIHGTLNHLIVADTIWLDRIEARPYCGWALNHKPCPDMATLASHRKSLDGQIVNAVDQLGQADIEGEVAYKTLSAPISEIRTPAHICWLHMMNHQTHHRGQVHDMLSQTEVPPPPLDLLYYVREAG